MIMEEVDDGELLLFRDLVRQLVHIEAGHGFEGFGDGDVLFDVFHLWHAADGGGDGQRHRVTH